jgi:predicted metalloendopeptidase
MRIATLLSAMALAAAEFDRSNFDPACAPCEDFHRYANGGWIDRNPIPARKSAWGTTSQLRDTNDERLRAILESVRASNARPGSNERKVGDLYAACMDTAGIDARGTKPIQPYLDRLAKVSTTADLADYLVWMQGEFPVGPIRVGSTQDRAKASDTIAAVGIGATSLPDRDYYLSQDDSQKKIRAEFVAHVARMFALLGDGAEEASRHAALVLAFETRFAEVDLERAARRDPKATYHPMDMAGVAGLSPTFPWRRLFAQLGVPESARINVDRLESVRLLEAQLAGAPIADWRTWLRWRIVNAAAELLAKPVADEHFKFAGAVLRGLKEQEPRWQVCAQAVDQSLGEALGQLYVAKHFPPAAKQRMNRLVDNMKATLRDELAASEWMSPETRANAVNKLDSFVAKVGYPDRWRDYSAVSVDPKLYFEGAVSAAKADRRRGIANIGKPVDKNEWGMTPPTVNAYYSSTRNEIVFPAGILQPPLFDINADDAINYAAIGAVIGHEIGHGFDDQGSKSDAQGNLRNWWTEEDRRKFESRAACVSAQFDSLDVGGGRRHNGKLVLGEALGDLGGLTLAYKAWRRSLAGREPAPVDGFTADQRFFLAFARLWAVHYTRQYEDLMLKTNPHPLGKYRLNATVMNMPEFHRAFSCKRGDSMVRPPDMQCRLW